jgi:hypothetical protein
MITNQSRSSAIFGLLPVYLSINISVTPVTGSQSLFAIVAGLLRLQVLNCSASSLFPLHFGSSFRRPGYHSLRPCVIHVHAILTRYFPFFPKLCCSHFLLITSFLTFNNLDVIRDLKKSVSVLNSIFFNLSKFHNSNLKCFVPLTQWYSFLCI